MGNEAYEIRYLNIIEPQAARLLRNLEDEGSVARELTLPYSQIYASAEMIGMVLALLVLKPYSEGFFNAAGADDFRKFKAAAGELSQRILGGAGVHFRRSDYSPDSDFSRAMAIEVELQDGLRMRVLLRDDYDKTKLDLVLDKLWDQLEPISRGEVVQLLDGVTRKTSFGGYIVVRFDEVLNSLIIVDPVVEAMRPRVTGA